MLLVDEGDLVFVTKQRYGNECGISVAFSAVDIFLVTEKANVLFSTLSEYKAIN